MSKKKTDKTIGLERGARFLEAVIKLSVDDRTKRDLVQVMFTLPIYRIQMAEDRCIPGKEWVEPSQQVTMYDAPPVILDIKWVDCPDCKKPAAHEVRHEGEKKLYCHLCQGIF